MTRDNLGAEPGTVSGEAQQTQRDPSAVPSPEGGSLVPPPSGDGPNSWAPPGLSDHEIERTRRLLEQDDFPAVLTRDPLKSYSEQKRRAYLWLATIDRIRSEAEALRGENARLLARLSDLHDQRCDLVDRTVGQLVDGDLGPSERLFVEMLERVLIDGKRLLDARHRLLHAVEREWTQGRGGGA